MRQIAETFLRFLLLGITSFGGPAAHIGYFRRTFVEELKWIDDTRFANLIALSQFLPGPASSQLGFAIGLHRAGLPGAIAAFAGFTLPSFLIMLGLALTGTHVAGLSDGALFAGAVHGLKLLAVVVVADACLGMYQNFCTDTRRSVLAIGTAVILLVAGSLLVQIVILVIAAALGVYLLDKNLPSGSEATAEPGRRFLVSLPLGMFAVLLLLSVLPLPVSHPSGQALRLAGDFYFAGSIVFGGGHVVLPILQELVAPSLTPEAFLTGYATAQALPGPMFSLATYLGALLWQEQPVIGALLATAGIFLPGFLLILAFSNSWHQLITQPGLRGAAGGINAAVVGLLLAVLYDPVITTGINSNLDMALVILGLFALRVLKLNVALLVLALGSAGVLITLV